MKAGPAVAVLLAVVTLPFVYALQSIAHTVDVYADTQNPATVGSLHFTVADEVLETFYTHKGPWLIHDMNKLTNASLSYDLIVYVDWYAPDSLGPTDKSLRELLDHGYTGKVWIFNHEPWYLFWPFLENSTNAAEVRAKPGYLRESWEIFNLPQVEWFVIAPHVAVTLQEYFHVMGINKTVRWACPVAPGSLKSPSQHAHWQAPQLEGKTGFAVQGAHSRRNDTGLFHQLLPRPDIVNNPRFQLQTYTWHTLDPATIPEEVASKVVGKTLYHFAMVTSWEANVLRNLQVFARVLLDTQ
ncbi:hypothetical protein WJX77_010749 [Trebouxia sp. C0004]